jgi:hypothetical protein
VTVEGQAIAVHAGGFPQGVAIAKAAGLDASDYTVVPSSLTTIADPKKSTCVFTYTPATGAVGAAPDVDDC